MTRRALRYRTGTPVLTMSVTEHPVTREQRLELRVAELEGELQAAIDRINELERR